MPLNWKKDEWSEMAKNDPAKFIQELQSMRAPSAKLFVDTYLHCAMEGFRALNSHANALYETQFFEALTRILPHREAKQPDKYTVSRLSYMETKRVPIAFLQWEEALRKNGHGVAKRDYHGWILKLRPKYWYDKENYKAFSLDNAPVWASAYVKAHRGESPFPLLQWLKTAPLQEGMPVISAIAAMEKETPPPWLARGLEAILERTDDIFQSGLIHETIGVLSTALASPTPASDQAILRLMREQPKGMSYMTHAWLGVFHRDGHHNNMLDWWNRLASAERGDVLHRWLGDSTSWEGLLKEVAKPDRPGLALDIFTRGDIALGVERARSLLEVAPLVKGATPFVARLVPALHVAQLVVDPADLRAYMLDNWDKLHEQVPSLNMEGLLDFEP